MNAVKVTNRAAAHLADPDKEFFGFATLLPYLEEALDELQVELIGHGSQFLKKSIDTTFQPSDDSLEIGLDDLVEPIKVSVVVGNQLIDLRQQLSQLEWTSSQQTQIFGHGLVAKLLLVHIPTLILSGFSIIECLPLLTPL